MDNETPETITAWANETFGPDVSPLRCAVRANLEMAELITAVTGNAPKELIAEECADVCIVLWRLLILTDSDDFLRPKFTGDPPEHQSALSALEANLELGDLMIWAAKGKLLIVGSVLGQILFYLHRLAWERGFDLQAEINRKMQINRARQWTRDGTGIGYHVKTTA